MESAGYVNSRKESKDVKSANAKEELTYIFIDSDGHQSLMVFRFHWLNLKA